MRGRTKDKIVYAFVALLLLILTTFVYGLATDRAMIVVINQSDLDLYR